MIVEVSIRIRPEYNQPSSTIFGDLTLSETFKIEVSDFSELASIVGEFHTLAKKVENGRS